MRTDIPRGRPGKSQTFRTIAVTPDGCRFLMARRLGYEQARAYWPDAWIDDVTIVIEREFED